jgi:hypothetical protein
VTCCEVINESTVGVEFLTVAKIKRFKEDYSGLGPHLTAAVDFWSKPRRFQILETSVDKMRGPTDGLLAREDVSTRIDKAAVDAESEAAFILIQDQVRGDRMQTPGSAARGSGLVLRVD